MESKKEFDVHVFTVKEWDDISIEEKNSFHDYNVIYKNGFVYLAHRDIKDIPGVYTFKETITLNSEPEVPFRSRLNRFEQKSVNLINWHMQCNVAKPVRDYIRELEVALVHTARRFDESLGENVMGTVYRADMRLYMDKNHTYPKNQKLKDFEMEQEREDLK